MHDQGVQHPDVSTPTFLLSTVRALHSVLLLINMLSELIFVMREGIVAVQPAPFESLMRAELATQDISRIHFLLRLRGQILVPRN